MAEGAGGRLNAFEVVEVRVHAEAAAAHVAVTDVLRGDDDVLAELLGLGLQTRKAFVCIAHA